MNRVEHFYDTHSDYEWERLERHKMEYALTMRTLAAHLPQPPCRVLDIGGGPGRYSISLAQMGYDVTLLDLSAGNLEVARRKAAEAGVTLGGFVHGNALDLGELPDAAYDAVLVMGPMYHLLTPEDRNRALQEARRVLKPGGVMAVAFINRYATIRSHQADWTVAHMAEVLSELETGVRLDENGRFTDAYAAHPSEVRSLLEQNGLTYVSMVAAEGLRSDIDGPVNHLTGDDWTAWVELNYRIGQDPTVQGAAVHLLAIARR